jgi:hypothetical protein
MRHLRLVSLFICLSALLIGTSGSARTLAPQAVSLTVNNPYCVQPSTASSTCLINLRYLSATSSDPNFLGVQITINGKTRAYFSNFFENSVYITDRMMGKGLQVTCGRPNASGLPGYGLQYNLGISAIVSGGSPTTDIAVVTCPAFESKLYLPIVKGIPHLAVK